MRSEFSGLGAILDRIYKSAGPLNKSGPTITFIDDDGRWKNIPATVNGQAVEEKDAIDLYRAGLNPSLGEFETREEAEEASMLREFLQSHME